jgi:hypothetical protein
MDADKARNATSPPASGRPKGRAGQLRLLDLTDRPEWCLDESTREVGRRGVEAARAALRSARRPDGDDPNEQHRRSTAA